MGNSVLTKKARTELKAKVFLALSTFGKRTSTGNLIQNVSVLNDLDARQVGAYLKVLAKEGRVKRYKDHTWAVIEEKEAKEPTVESASAYILVSPAKNRIVLRIGGLELPIQFET